MNEEHPTTDTNGTEDRAERTGFAPEVSQAIDRLVQSAAATVQGRGSGRRNSLVEDMVRTSLRLLGDGSDLGQVKVMERALREMRNAYGVFNRWKGVRPQTRGVAMNPVDHPLGGGEGKTSGGRHPVSPWGQPEGRTRLPKASDALIIRRRRGRGSRR